MDEPLIFERSHPGLRGYHVDDAGHSASADLDALREDGFCCTEPPTLPEVSEVDVIRHYTRLSALNYHVDQGLYPLGSCTMKHNPKMNERLCRLSGFTGVHPLLPAEDLQGTLEMLWLTERYLADVTGLPCVSLQPCAGAHGELASLMMIQAFWRDRGEDRDLVVVPDSAHGTNPASAAMCGYRVEEVASGPDGCVDLAAFKQLVDERCACVMLTNPNTLGLFETGILDIAAHCREVGAKLYCDGANMNALLSRARPGDMGFDIMHLNLHKTFSTPHGGGGPGCGPVTCTEELEPYLPVPRIQSKDGRFVLETKKVKSIGSMHSFFGNVGVIVRAFAYLETMGFEGLRAVSEAAVLNANYLRVRLRELLPVPYDRICMHEFVMSGKPPKECEGGAGNASTCKVHTLDIAKRLLDLGFHAPTVYFPLIVDEALMVEPTETESRRELDRFVRALEQIVRERSEDPDKLLNAPTMTPVRRFDETTAARKPDLCFCCCD